MSIVLFIFLLHEVRRLHTAGTFDLGSLTSLGSGKLTQATTIPNIVHFVHMIRGSDEEPVFEIAFRQFIAIYSAQYYLNPGTIYIHTNIEERLIEAAINASMTPYSHILTRLPNIIFNQVSPPLRTSRGKDVHELAHRSDLVRTQVLKEWGGLYLDEDSYVIKDLRPLRNSGFRTIVGLESDDKISNAVIFTAPGSNLITTFEALQEDSYDGDSTAHSMDLLTHLAQDFSGTDKGVLILPRQAFYSIDEHGLKDFYRIDQVDPDERPLTDCEECQDVNTYLEKADEEDEDEDSRVNWRGAYVLHGCDSALRDMQEHEDVFGSDGDITVEYVLERKSLFASAVYPAIRHAMDAGLLDGIEDELTQVSW